MNGATRNEGEEATEAQVVLDALLGASLDAIQLLACVIRGESTGPQGQPIRSVQTNDRIGLAQHLLVHAGPLADQLRGAMEKPDSGIH